jgi:hypothetical protein
MKAGFVITAASLLLMGAAAVRTEPEKPGAKGGPVKLEPVSGSNVKRVTLTARAAERLGIQTSKVREESVVRRLMVSGLVTVPAAAAPSVKPGATVGFASFTMHSALTAAPKPLAVPASSRVAPAGAASQRLAVPAVAAQEPLPAPATAPIQGDAWVLVTLSQGEWEKLDKDKPARILPLASHEMSAAVKEVLARPSGMAPIEDSKRAMLTVYYVASGKDHGLVVNKRVRVELQQSGNEEKRKVMPYSAVYYDAKGVTWAYVNAAPLVFERRRIGVERIMGDLAVLSEAPPIGTDVVTVGAPLLQGAEIFGK